MISQRPADAELQGRFGQGTFRVKDNCAVPFEAKGVPELHAEALDKERLAIEKQSTVIWRSSALPQTYRCAAFAENSQIGGFAPSDGFGDWTDDIYRSGTIEDHLPDLKQTGRHQLGKLRKGLCHSGRHRRQGHFDTRSGKWMSVRSSLCGTWRGSSI